MNPRLSPTDAALGAKPSAGANGVVRFTGAGDDAGTAGRKRRNAEDCFTLIELLVTIAIIAVLAGLLLGGVGMAKRKADETTCMNHLRQIAMATQAYQNDDSKKRIPSYDTGSRNAFWNGAANRFDNLGKLWQFQYLKDKGILYDPCDKGALSANGPFNANNIGVSGTTTALNYVIRLPVDGLDDNAGTADFILACYNSSTYKNHKNFVWAYSSKGNRILKVPVTPTTDINSKAGWDYLDSKNK